MPIEINENVLKKEINQGIVPLGVPAAYKYDTALVENAKALVNASLNQIKNGYGYPFTAATAAAMADTTKIYVYTGSETGYTNGNWYYWNGTAWVSGGVYNATALETDKTLTVSGTAADAAVVGEMRDNLYKTVVFNVIGGLTLKNISNYNNETGSFTRSESNFVDFSGLVDGHKYKLILSNTVRMVGARNYGYNYDAVFPTPTQNDCGYYETEFEWTYGNKTVCISEPSTTVLNVAMYDVTYVDETNITQIKNIKSSLSVTMNVLDIADDVHSMNKISCLKKETLTAVRSTYNSKTCLIETNVNFGGVTVDNVLYGHKYRFIFIPKKSTECVIGITDYNHSSYVVTKQLNAIAYTPYYLDVLWKWDNTYTFVLNTIVDYYLSVYDITEINSDYLDNVMGISSYALTFANKTTDKIGNEEVLCYGDSLTQGLGTGLTPYPAILDSLISEKKIYNFGVGGEACGDIGARQGGIPIYINPCTIPANGSEVPITFSTPGTLLSASGLIKQIQTDIDVSVNPCIVDGVNCYLRYDLNSNRYMLHRNTPSSNDTVIDRPMRIFTNGYYRKKDILVIWMGTNNAADSNVAEMIIRTAENMINHNSGNKYIILSLTSKLLFGDNLEIVNNKLADYFGDHYLDIRDYLLEYGLADADVTPTQQDTTDISNGEIPTSLRIDTVHFNTAGYTVIANCVYKKGVELGYWN